MRVLDLFSGIGGFSLGLERAGMRTVAFCETDEYCRAVLRKHWPGVPCFGDIRALDAIGLGGLGPIDLICGGFPCQPFSVAGKRAAHDDDRYLWPEMREVIALKGPAWVIGENVTGIISVALDDVCSDLEALGYTTRSFVIPACAVGAHHQRDRVWIVANSDRQKLRDEPGRRGGPDGEGAPEPGYDGAAGPTADAYGQGQLQPQGSERQGWRRDSDGAGSHAPDADGQRPQERFLLAGIQGEAGRDNDGQDAALDPWRSAEPPVVRKLHGIPARLDRISALGNAVVPQVVEEIGRAIMKLEQSK